MRKLRYVFLVLVLTSILVVTACGGGETTTTTTQPATTATTSEPTTTETTEPDPTTPPPTTDPTTPPTTEPTTIPTTPPTTEPTTPPEPGEIVITSTAFEEGGIIPDTYSCDGADISPELNWTGVPEGTHELALVMDDPDAPGGTFVHWVINDIPPDLIGLEENLPKTMELANGAVQGLNDFMGIGYGGPCPPAGQSHRYFFTLYAIDADLELGAVLNKGMLLATIEGHVLAEAQLMGNFQS